ncbi:MAG TPA: hypothetical protein VMY06_14785 [Sedimentisphaerales bacterium]|nr:hypothetical protein [Sedimentisphaerales bacterium]HUU15592.1 hypothetical protein [Sedimentisphaerales bacterium]
MFEGKTTITFSEEAAMLMMSQNVSDMFKMPLEVTAMGFDYNGLEVKFGPVKEKVPEPQAVSPAVRPKPESEQDEPDED